MKHLASIELHHAVNQLNAACAAALDEARYNDWPNFFTETARYTVQARENFERGLPLALIDLESRSMMLDRVFGVTQTIFHAPYYMRHIVSPSMVQLSDMGVITAQTNYAVFRTKPASVSKVYNVGRYIDTLVWVEKGSEKQLKIQSRRCVYDSEIVLNSLIYPI